MTNSIIVKNIDSVKVTKAQQCCVKLSAVTRKLVKKSSFVFSVMPGKMAWLKYSTVINLIRIHLRLTRVKVKTKMHSYLKCVMSNTFGTLVGLMVNLIEEGSCGWHLVEKIKNSMKSQKKKNSKYILVYSSQGSQEGTNTEMMQRGKKWMNEMKTVTSVWQHTWLQSVFRSRVQVKISRRRLLQLWFWFVCVICSVPTSVRTK